MSKPIILTLGEPAGIGVDLFLLLAQQNKLPKNLKVVADKNLLIYRAHQLNLEYNIPDSQIIQFDVAEINCCGHPTIKNVKYILQTLEYAITACLRGEFAAIVTGPVHKAIINQAGIPFSGHTEYLAKKAGVARTIMCFENTKLRIALATTHIPLAAVPGFISKNVWIETLKLLHDELQQKFKIYAPIIAVCGLNPHAGEGGYIGKEEQEIIIPGIKKLISEGIKVEGPYPADTIFHQTKANCFFSLYHDQLLPALKMHHFYETVNITLGLPFLRTSVDHGTALELAGTGKANPASLNAAINTALKWC